MKYIKNYNEIVKIIVKFSQAREWEKFRSFAVLVFVCSQNFQYVRLTKMAFYDKIIITIESNI